jgi:hypothetical protein
MSIAFLTVRLRTPLNSLFMLFSAILTVVIVIWLLIAIWRFKKKLDKLKILCLGTFVYASLASNMPKTSYCLVMRDCELWHALSNSPYFLIRDYRVFPSL